MPAERIRGFDGLRAIAATGVFLSHAWGHAGYPRVAVPMGSHQLVFSNLLGLGTSGVVLFFALSGFLLSRPFWLRLQGEGEVDLRVFLRRRVWRIYPAYLIAVLLFAAFYDVNHPAFTRFVHVVTHLTLTHNLTEVTIYNISAPLWSVATEFQLYLGLPVLFWVLGRLLLRFPVADLGKVAVGVFCASLVVGVGFYQGAHAFIQRFAVNPRIVSPTGSVILHSPFVGGMFFCAGVAAAFFLLQSHRSPVPTWAGRLMSAAVWIGLAALFAEVVIDSAYLKLPEPAQLAVMACLYAGIVYCVSISAGRVGVAAVLDVAPMRWLGAISYSFYLYHDYALWLAYDRLPRAGFGAMWSSSVKALLAFGLSLVFAWLSYVLIERAGIAWGRRLERRSLRQQPVPA